MTTATETQPTITLSNFRVEYRAPRYEDSKVLYDGYCAILADSAEHDGAEVRVFDVPDVDEGQLAAALFACDAMNRYERLKSALEQVRAMFFEDARAGANVVDGKLEFADNDLHPWIPGARAPKAIAIIDDALEATTTTSK